MDGLWTIRWQPFTASSPGGYKVGGSEPWPGEDPTPVVPCDDAAVERGARAVEREMESRGGGDEYLYEMDEDVRAEFLQAIAEVVLRAAGEPPSDPNAR